MSVSASFPSEPRLRAIAGAIVATAAVTAVAMSVSLLWAHGAFEPQPPLVRAVDDIRLYAQVEGAFDRAVRARFSVGSAEGDMIRDLGAQGFVPDWSWPPGGHSATYATTSFPCMNAYSVVWKVDAAGRLTEISGRFHPSCL